MSKISLIAAVDEQYGLGKNNQLLCHLPADLQYFKQNTLHKPIIMGRKTWESIGKPLPERMNIVVSRQLKPIEGITVVDSLEKALQVASYAPEIMIIGGAQLFAEALPLAQRIYLTHIHHVFDADVFFPALDKAVWKPVSSVLREGDEKNQWDITFAVLETST